MIKKLNGHQQDKLKPIPQEGIVKVQLLQLTRSGAARRMLVTNRDKSIVFEGAVPNKVWELLNNGEVKIAFFYYGMVLSEVIIYGVAPKQNW